MVKEISIKTFLWKNSFNLEKIIVLKSSKYFIKITFYVKYFIKIFFEKRENILTKQFFFKISQQVGEILMMLSGASRKIF